MRILFFDFETTGLDTSLDRITEAAYVLYDYTHSRLIQAKSIIMHDDSYPVISAEAQKITGIKPNMFFQNNEAIPCVSPPTGLEQILRMFEFADFSCAHNGAEYDLPILKSEVIRNNMGAGLPKINLIDTMTDLPVEYGSKKLQYIAAELGIVNPMAHSALYDCLTLMQVVLKHNITDILELSRSPSIRIKACTPYDHRDKASKAGYRWNPDAKIWEKKIKIIRLEEERKKLAPFSVEQIG
jgi:DNA polymerase III alpha subunit (gram-positive type)